jgi:hypothetical protein
MYQKLSVFPPFSLCQTSSFSIKSANESPEGLTLAEKIG